MYFCNQMDLLNYFGGFYRNGLNYTKQNICEWLQALSNRYTWLKVYKWCLSDKETFIKKADSYYHWVIKRKFDAKIRCENIKLQILEAKELLLKDRNVTIKFEIVSLLICYQFRKWLIMIPLPSLDEKWCHCKMNETYLDTLASLQ